MAALSPVLLVEAELMPMEELLERLHIPTAYTESYDDYPTAQEEEEAYAIPRDMVQPRQRQEPQAEPAGCVPASWERWHVERNCRERGRRSRFSGR